MAFLPPDKENFLLGGQFHIVNDRLLGYITRGEDGSDGKFISVGNFVNVGHMYFLPGSDLPYRYQIVQLQHPKTHECDWRILDALTPYDNGRRRVCRYMGQEYPVDTITYQLTPETQQYFQVQFPDYPTILFAIDHKGESHILATQEMF